MEMKLSILQREWEESSSFWATKEGHVKKSKLAGKALALSVGVPAPETYWAGHRLPAYLPTPCVIKPDGGVGGRGVFKIFDRDEVQVAGIPGNELYLAERLLQHDGCSYKLWCFSGEPKVIQVNDMRCRRRHFYTEKWESATTLNFTWLGFPVGESREAPASLSALLDAGRAVADKFAVPFARVDMYVEEGVPVFGELCCFPHDLNFPGSVDRFFGGLWNG